MTFPVMIWPLLAMSMISALLAGVFLTFSDFLMRAMHRSAPTGGTEVMQKVNREVYRSVFMAMFLGMVPVSALMLGYAALWLSGPLAQWLIAASALYLFGVFAVTAAGNVPMNNRLDAMPLAGAEAQAYWPAYVRGWLRWNHLRGVASLGVSVSYAMAALLLVAGA